MEEGQSEPRQRVLQAGHQLFLHFGFRRTTMCDLAREAGMSRPTLYALFPNKQAVFTAVVRQRIAEIAAELTQRLDQAAKLEDKLDAAFELTAINAFKKRNETPFGREVFDLAAEIAAEILDDAQERFAEVLAAGLEAHEQMDGLPADRLARLIITAARGLGDHARNLAELEHRLADFKAVLLRASAASRPHRA